MAILFTKFPSDVVFSGNPITLVIKDTNALTTAVNQKGVSRIAFSQGISQNNASMSIVYGSFNYTYTFLNNNTGLPYLPIIAHTQTLQEYVNYLASILQSKVDLAELFHITVLGTNIYFIERTITAAITISINIYGYPVTGVTCSKIFQSLKANTGLVHSIGLRPAKVQQINLAVEEGTIEEVYDYFGEGIEISSSTTIVQQLNAIAEQCDGSMSIEKDISNLVKEKKTGHFTLSDTITLRDLATKFKIYAWSKKNIPAERMLGSFSDPIYVMYANVTRVMQAKLNELGTTVYNYIVNQRKFLTWSPDNKVIDVYQPERISWLLSENVTDAEYKCKEYFSDGTNATHTVGTFTAVKYQVVEFSASFIYARSNTSKTVLKYEVWLQKEDGTIFSEIRHFIMSYKYEPNVRYWFFLNGFGVYECIRTTGPSEKSGKIEKNYIDKQLPAEYTVADREREQVSESTEYRIKTSSGPLNKRWAQYFLEFLDSEDVRLLLMGKAIPADIQADKFKFEDDSENIISHEFEAIITAVDEEKIDTSITIPIVGDFNGDFNESYFTD
jgi:hypothetical protein